MNSYQHQKDLHFNQTHLLANPHSRGKGVYLLPTTVSGNIKPTELKIGLKVSHDYNINFLH